jgi:integrase
LPSGRFQVRFKGPDGNHHTGPRTFSFRRDAEGFLANTMREIELGIWEPAKPETEEPPVLADYARAWLAKHPVDETSRDWYRRSLENHVLPALGDMALADITPQMVRSWYAEVAPGLPRARAGAYQRLRQVMGHALHEGLIPANPCTVKGGSKARTDHDEEPATEAEMKIMWESMPERFRLAVLLAGLAGLRSGELRELRRKDIDLAKSVLHVRRGVRRRGSTYEVALPKGKKTRTVPIPAHLVQAIEEHLRIHAAPGPDGLLFPRATNRNEHVREQTFNNWWIKAREAAGRPSFRMHDLRHTALTWHQIAGATLKETMAVAGHSTPEVAMRYQHAARSRLEELAAKLPDIGVRPSPPTDSRSSGSKKK